MLRRVLVIVAVSSMVVFCVSGCKKRSGQSEVSQPRKEAAKTAVQYEAEAKEQINKDNMAAELERLEKEIDQDAAANP
ncbi:MAG TPA: hypothetical protein VMW16_02535 [Sedimentisphaerales bacterium]|nr:hypothetical protein [Sedimentisphaerales bacterium]